MPVPETNGGVVDGSAKSAKESSNKSGRKHRVGITCLVINHCYAYSKN